MASHKLCKHSFFHPFLRLFIAVFFAGFPLLHETIVA